MGKIKIHEIAKELDINSKEVISKAKELKIKATSHLSGVTEEEAKKIKDAFSNSNKNKNKKKNEKKQNAKTNNKVEEKNSQPVIIRREVIINDEENKSKIKNVEESNKKDNNIGFVERDRKKDFNIVYRNKPNKPMTVDELFGLNKKKKEEPKEEVVEKRDEDKKEAKIEKKENINPNKNNNYNKNKNEGSNYNNKNNNINSNRNNNSNNSYNNRNKFNNNGFNKNNNFNKNNRPLDDREIEKNIKNIFSDTVEKESVREYNKSIDKQKSNSKYEKANKKNSKSRRGGDLGFNEGKLKNLKQADNLSNMFNDQEGGMLDYYDLTTVRGKRSKKKNNKNKEESKQKIFKLTEITIPETISVKDLAIELKKTSSDVIKKLLSLGIMATINNDVDFDTAFLVAQEFGVTATKKQEVKEEDILFDESKDAESDLKARPPVIVVMGHVDHGKTSLLDTIRKTNVIEGEAGGITQAIGAYQVKIDGRDITFLDTPGHEAFTAMRARGAQITDIAILVIAANDGVMPQTVEAINHAKSAGIPIIVAVNKIDLPGANIEKIKEDLTQYELVPEEWGGDTIYVPISAKNNTNIDKLLEMVLLVADMQDLKANPNKQAKGAVIEARLDKAKGPIATMLVQRGRLDIGDTIVVGSSIGRIRAMKNDRGQRVKAAGPSTPVEIMGLTEVPSAGDIFYEVKDEKMAKHLIERRKRQAREKSINKIQKVTLDDLFNQIEEGNLKELNIIVKADVQGSVEAVRQSLEKLSNEEVRVKVIHAAAGAVTESDVTLAKVSNAIIIAFNVRPVPSARDMAEKDEVEIKQYSIIYQAIEDVEAAMKGMLDPEFEEQVIGNLEIRQTFKVSSVGTIAGCFVLSGKVKKDSQVRIIRDEVVIHSGELASLKRFKDDVKEVTKGFECGLQIVDFNDIKEGDLIEVFEMIEIKR